MSEAGWGAGCIYPRKGQRCGRAARTRGLCPTCYQRIYLLIKAGKTSWAREIKAGRALAAVDKQIAFGRLFTRRP